MSSKRSERTLRVFISSTFQDMSEERDELVKHVFPAVRRLCESRHVTWGEVDLRWGITDEQTAEGHLLPICLREIENCSYFIGMLGARYGHVPDRIPSDLRAAYPWLREHAGHSITEVEMSYGALSRSRSASQAFFYFRGEPSHADQPAGDEARQKLAALKDKIWEAHRSGILSAPPREGYTNARALAELVRADLEATINDLYPEGSQPHQLDSEATDHAVFRQGRAAVYVGRPALYQSLDDHVVGESLPLVVTGDSGSGKSALLANWIDRFLSSESPAKPHLLIEHYVGANRASADWTAIVRRILGELNRRWDLDLEIPDQAEALRAAFGNGLYRAAARGRTLLVLDGLNQLEERDGGLDLGWLPPVLPANVRVVLSTSPGRSLQALADRGWPQLHVDLLSETERVTLLERYLKQYGKALSAARIERLSRAKQSANPLYLRVLLEELRQWGEHDKLDKRIAHYLEAQSVPALYDKVLERWEVDFEREQPSLVADAMCSIWATRRGVAETEMLELLGADGVRLPYARFSPLYLAAGPALANRSGLIGFSHDFLRQAVQTRYLATPEDQAAAHIRLGRYFQAQAFGPRQIDELPWQLARAGEWQALYAKLAEGRFFAAAWTLNEFDVKRYWAEVESNSQLRMTDAYAETIRNDCGQLGWLVGLLLQSSGHPEEALAIHTRLVLKHRSDGDFENLQACLGNQANVLYACGRLEEAMTLQHEKERICRQIGNLHSLAASLGAQGLILQGIGRLEEAMARHKEAESLARQIGSLDGVKRCLGNQGLILRARGQLDEAMAMHKAEERICRQQGDLEGLQRTAGNQGAILYALGRRDEAMLFFREAERICRQIGNADGLQRSLGDQAVVLHQAGQLEEALALHKEEERICRQIGSVEGLLISLGNQAAILADSGRLDEAMRVHKEEQALCRQFGNPEHIVRSQLNQALLLVEQGRRAEADALATSALQLAQDNGLEGLVRRAWSLVMKLRSKTTITLPS